MLCLYWLGLDADLQIVIGLLKLGNLGFLILDYDAQSFKFLCNSKNSV